MDESLFPKNFKTTNANQMAFLKKASIVDVCTKYASYERHKTTQGMSQIIKTLEMLLDHLTEIGKVRCLKNPNTGWNIYQPINSQNNLNYQLKGNAAGEVKVKPAKLEHVNDDSKKPTYDNFDHDMDFSTSDYELSGIDLVCAIAAKFRALAFSARSRGIKFDLSLDDIQDIILAKKCYYTNVTFDNKDNLKTVDRINNKKGYVKGNVVACTDKINQFKNEILENKKSRLFNDVADLKKFVDILYATTSESSNPLVDLIVKN